MDDAYRALIDGKRRGGMAHGFIADDVPSFLFAHQAAIVRWALRLGRAAIFADTGLGKTAMQLVWADAVCSHTGGRVLILSPLAVREQTIAEAVRFGIDAGEVGSQARIHVTNYHQLHNIDTSEYAGVVLDESSILKSQDGATRNTLIETFRDHRFRLACTATPAPNDFTEIGNHAEFLGVSSRAEMLAEYFVHDGGSTSDWRIKGHAVRDFWRWVASWAVLIRRPGDLGIDDDRYDLPTLNVSDVVVALDAAYAAKQGSLFVTDAQTLADQRLARRSSLDQRVDAVADLARAPGQWIVWCELNDESSALAAAIDGAVEVKGSDDHEHKARSLLAFARGEIRVLVTKPSIAGFGLNWQGCHQMAFVGVSHSYEQWYQAVRRCWRFGQSSAVDVYMVRSDADGAVWKSLKAKADRADQMATEMIQHVSDTQLESVLGRRPGKINKAEKSTEVPSWL